METFTALKIVHSVATVLFVLSALGLAGWVIRGRFAGDALVQNRTLQLPWVLVWALMGLCMLTLPVSGWWLVHYGGWPLSQTWLLTAEVLYLFGSLSWLWLLVRLNRLRVPGATGNPKLTVALAVFSGLCFIAIAGLMGAKPV
ncbi:DUF2269 family protein [Pseudomonas sp. MH9.2]|uniref:DUF2269 family protein n=1 Tax=Pseudomonas sp. MH9.2 TaxID=3048629 RepID=UPI002AC8D3A9|nr:DUF2269 family protein [Pseudomonas sp. MH9.2]MEB0028097.1 DUF2269 family protein [Pseudomonas sp. MH9.2]WPX67380.1 DUF2269 family protein [Pseudomonas sp. MH9.2]